MTVTPLVPSDSASAGTSCAWPPAGGRQTARKPEGGFIDCPVEYLTLPWWIYQQGAMRLGTLRVWLGTLELVEKRCGAAPDVPAHYGPEELRRLLRWPRLAPVTTAVQQLETLGLLAWSPRPANCSPRRRSCARPLPTTAIAPCRPSSPQGCAGCPCHAVCCAGSPRRGSRG